jgi:PAS domain S-box-containing protein
MPEGAEAGSARPAGGSPAQASRRILVVEDSRTQAEHLHALLTDAGYDVALAENGSLALERVRASPPDLVVSDVVMPEMDGYTFCRALKSQPSTRAIPVVLLTGQRTPADIIRGLEYGADNFITKPFDDDYLLERIRRIFEHLDHRAKGRLEMEVAVRVAGREIVLNADKQQIVELLFATSEELSQTHTELTHTKREIEEYARTLEERVRERTRELAQTEAKYRLLFESNPQPMWVFDTESLRFLVVNDAAVAHYGYSHAEFREMTIADIRLPEDVAGLLENLEKSTTRESSGPWRHRRKDGSLMSVEIASHALTFEGRPARLVLAKDVTQQRRLEEQLRQAQKLEAVGRLAGGVAHDFNNLLGIITGYTDLAIADVGSQHPGYRRLAEIRKAAERAAALTRQLLAFSRRQVLQPRVLDLNQVLGEVEKMLRRLIGEDIQLVTVFSEDLARVKADAGQMEQVIMNLAVNARDAMPHGGRLILETANATIDEAHARSHADARAGEYVMLAVTDTGSGIDPAVLPHIFEPFFTTKEPDKGTGLGLATVYGIVRQSDGHISVYSEPGSGTTFKVYLPRVDAPADAAAAQRPPAGSVVGGRERILLVEDAASLRELIAEVLRDAGYTVADFARPDEALAFPGAPCDLLLTDVVMPAMSGRELAQRVRSGHAGVRVLFMSGYTDNAIAQNGILDAGADLLQKPFTTDALLRRVRDVLDAPPRPRSD